jgi:hypothetical protein
MTNNPAIIEAAKQALRDNFKTISTIEVILAAVTPLIRTAALEEAAKIFDEDSYHLFDGQGIAAAIRALISSSPSPSSDSA